MYAYNYYKQKYNYDNMFHVKKSLIYFDDVPENSWKSIKMIKDKLNVNNVKTALINEVNKLDIALRNEI
ncbi:hypothetical protein AGMMS50293_27170 [Spirochaetia bacterium]|nr:hypothetical protein AGMMS50293_27170 [Spirochaetia bacterium]